jgi:hypothetical protein
LATSHDADAHLDLRADLARPRDDRIGSFADSGQIALRSNSTRLLDARDRRTQADRCAGQADRFRHVRQRSRRTLAKSRANLAPAMLVHRPDPRSYRTRPKVPGAG